MAAAAAALRPGELSKSDLESAIGKTVGTIISYRYFNSDPDRYIIHVTGEKRQDYHQTITTVYITDNHGYVSMFQHAPPNQYSTGPPNIYEFGSSQGDNSPVLRPIEIEFIKAMPIYSPTIGAIFRRFLPKLCDDAPENKKKGASATVPAAAAGAGGAAAAAASVAAADADEDPTVGGYRRRKRTVKRVRKSRRR